jgi:phosphatidylglycerol---prolipoprotein diacylglyceryl transferase
MFTHPGFNPIALQIGSFGIHWYGLMYLVGFFGGLWLGQYQVIRLRKIDPASPWQERDPDDMLFYIALGVVFGGRLGYVLFYQPMYFLQHPLEIFALWQGGMSFHGGFIGVMVAMALFARKRGVIWLQLMDFVAPLVPIGLGAGRLGNFINAELWGRPTQSDWGMVFPQVDAVARHPSQLYEFALEGIALFLILWLFAGKKRPIGAISALFLLCYGSFRFLVEFTREPDSFLGLLSLGLSMGQWLCLPMILVGLGMMRWAYRKS